jgi:hypothetical protein
MDDIELLSPFHAADTLSTPIAARWLISFAISPPPIFSACIFRLPPLTLPRHDDADYCRHFDISLAFAIFFDAAIFILSPFFAINISLFSLIFRHIAIMILIFIFSPFTALIAYAAIIFFRLLMPLIFIPPPISLPSSDAATLSHIFMTPLAFVRRHSRDYAATPIIAIIFDTDTLIPPLFSPPFHFR